MKNRRKQMLVLILLLLTLLGTPLAAQAASFSKTAPKVTVKKMVTSVKLSWSKRSDLTGWQIYQTDSAGNELKLIKKTKKTSYLITNLTQGTTYYYKVRGYQKKNGKLRYTKYSKVLKVKLSATLQQSTLKKLLLTGLEPVGQTMYVWGGGWNLADTGGGEQARTIGVSPEWKAFFEKQTASYDYNTTRYQVTKGLDCSGYIGWCIYNILNTTNGQSGYVMSASKMAKEFASRGWGTYTSRSGVKNYRAGDIMSSSGHVWMVVGQCSDGSVVLLHSSPPGVQLAGTPSTSGKTNSKAVRLATSYMKKYFPAWYKKYPNCAKNGQYLTNYGRMRWDLTGNAIMTDPDGYSNMSAEEILADLFASR